MDFFEIQAHAKKRTARLVWLFVLAVAGTIALTYFAAIIWLAASGDGHWFSYRYHADVPAVLMFFWHPWVFLIVTAYTLAVVGIAARIKWNEYASGGCAVAEDLGAHRIDSDDADDPGLWDDPNVSNRAKRRLRNVVEEMAIASGIPVPAVYVLYDEPAINAFAAGLTTSDAAVCVTSGALTKLTRDELQGVIGHEFSHILNGDMRLNLRLAALTYGILCIGLCARICLWPSRRQLNPFRKHSRLPSVEEFAAGVVLLIIGYVGYFFGRVILAGVSRQREFLADASAVQFTRNPAGIAGALKKIGGHPPGSSLQADQAAAIGHFFFAQCFRSRLNPLWATHPPLVERIRAIEPQFDGKMNAPPEAVDLPEEFMPVTSLARDPCCPLAEAARFTSATPPVTSAPGPRLKLNLQPAAAIAAIGALTDNHFRRAQQLLDALPSGLRSAARDPALAPVVVYGLLVDGPPEIRAKQQQLVATHAGPEAAAALPKLRPPLSLVDPAARLPLLQLCLPALRTLDAAALDRFVTTLDTLAHADSQVSAFEFALQKMLIRSLKLGRQPGSATVQVQAFPAVTAEISVVLSALAHTSSNVDLGARAAFAAGAAQIRPITSQLAFLGKPACDFAALDAALDRLAAASLPIKQRALVAAAHVVGADGQILVTEAELLRAVSAALDIPMPPLA